ncbi:MAG: TolC family protein [Bacteroidota bacterium]
MAENQASQRPELALFDAQQGMARLQAESLGAQRLPKVGAFAQGGLGRPNPFNFLEVNTSPFFMAGVQFNWNIWDWKRTQRDQQNLAIQENLIEVYREQHQDQVALQVAQEEAEIETMRRLLEQDTRLIALQESILSRVNTQLQNGTVKPSDYLQEVEALTQSKLQQQIHEVRLRQSEVERAIHQGKY